MKDRLILTSDRLQLIPLQHRELLLWQKDRHELERSLGLQPSDMLVDPLFRKEIDDALPHWAGQTRRHADEYYWYTNWEIVLRSQNRSIGGIGLGGPPREEGVIELGYYIDGHYHRQGFATEALRSLLHWAFAQAGVRVAQAFTPPDNRASQRVLEKCGFHQDGVVEGNLRWEKGAVEE
ncbi:MAG: GNAT family N-acetyltransferase [Saprospiraceae bacterium]|nr:GNAT family N-acetyltransferase [Saprospiraceae bacterium]MCB0679392.1 GNAT family N-acetyltransferase [Saprospiraceae bacterium]